MCFDGLLALHKPLLTVNVHVHSLYIQNTLYHDYSEVAGRWSLKIDSVGRCFIITNGELNVGQKISVQLSKKKGFKAGI